jgi:hypothetical protein
VKPILAFLATLLFILTIPVWLIVAAVLCGFFGKEMEDAH